MGVLKIAGGILLAVAILVVAAIVIIGVATYPEYAKQEYRKRMTFDQDGDRKLNKFENARYIADKDGLEEWAAVYYTERGCTYKDFEKSFDCPKDTPDWDSPEGQAEIKAIWRAEEAERETKAAKEQAEQNAFVAETVNELERQNQVLDDCQNKGLEFMYCQGLKDAFIHCRNKGLSLDYCQNQQVEYIQGNGPRERLESGCVINRSGYVDCLL